MLRDIGRKAAFTNTSTNRVQVLRTVRCVSSRLPQITCVLFQRFSDVEATPQHDFVDDAARTALVTAVISESLEFTLSTAADDDASKSIVLRGKFFYS